MLFRSNKIVVLETIKEGKQVYRREAKTASSGGNKVSGTVSYRERMALLPGVEIKVELVDVSRADAPATVIASQTISPDGKQVPIPFEIAYDTAEIEPNHTYAVQARIEARGKVRFINDKRYEVLTRGAASTADILLVAARGTAEK